MRRIPLILLILFISNVSFGQIGPITGSFSLCSGTTTTLADTTAGGTWSSSNTSIATVGSASGIVTGVTSGIATITYTTGSFVTQTITVNAMPAPITGSTSFCIGNSVILSNTITGGSWTSSNPAVAVIGSSSGIATGIAAGSASITYTLITGCNVTTVITANPTPAPITGAASFCTGTTTTLSSGTFGGTWSSSNPAIATVGTSTGIVTGVAAGTTLITYTLGTGCTTSRTVTSNPLPPVYVVSGGGNFCPGGPGVSVGLGGSDLGVDYFLYVGTTIVAGPVAGTGAPISFGMHTTSGTYTATATSAASCVSGMAGSVSVAPNVPPPLYTVSGGGPYCSGGTGVPVNLSNSSTSCSYQLYNGTTAVGFPVSGTGAPLSFGLQTAAGIYTVAATDLITTCSRTMTASASVVVNPIPNVYTVTGGGPYCSGGIGRNISLINSESGVNYQLYNGATMVGSTLPGTGSLLSFGLYTATGTYTVLGTYATTGCAQNMIGSAAISIQPPPTAFSVGGGGSVCPGGSGVNIILASSEVGVSYQLFNGSTPNGAPLTGTGSSLDFGAHTMLGLYTVAATNIATGCIGTMTGSANITASISPTAFTVTGGGSYCAGGAGLPVTLIGSQTGISYQLYNGAPMVGSPMAGTGSSLDFGFQTVNGSYTVIATNTATGCTALMTGTATIMANPLPAIYSVTGGGGYCAGGAGAPVSLNGSNTGISYSLYNSTGFVGSVPGTGATLSFGSMTTAGAYTVIATDMATTCASNMTGSAVVSINPLPNVFTLTGGGSYCAGSAGAPVGLASSNSGINYQLKIGGVSTGLPVGGTGSVLNFGPQAAAGTYTVVATNTTTGCIGNMSGSVVVTITATVTPTVTASVTPNDTICAGTAVTFTSAAVNGGSAPIYTWYKNGSVAGTSSTYTYTPANGDVIILAMTSSAVCATPSLVFSNTINMTVLPMPTTSTVPSLCLGSNATFTGTPGGIWTSSNPAVAIITTVGSITGYVTPISAGVTVISYSLSGCLTSSLLTINAVPLVTAASTPSACGGTYTLTATGGASWSWAPATGLTCSTCSTTVAEATASTTYTVTGTSAEGCADKATVSIFTNRVSGHISYSGVSTDILKVWLIRFSAADSSLVAEDSTLTCMNNGTPYFEFNYKPAGNYMVKAKLEGTIPGTSGYIPTYSLSTPYWYAAASVAHTTAVDTMHINMLYGTVPPGPGFIGGLISSGAGKGTAIDVPSKGMLVYLKDATSNFILTYTYTDANGAFSFNNIAHGNYIVYPEDFGYTTTPSSVIMLGATSDSAKGINFREYTSSRVVMPVIVNSVKAISTEGEVSVYPNPASRVLNIKWNNNTSGNADLMISDMTGREVYRSAIDINAAAGKSQIDLGDLKNGIYFVTIKSGTIFYSSKLMIQQ